MHSKAKVLFEVTTAVVPFTVVAHVGVVPVETGDVVPAEAVDVVARDVVSAEAVDVVAGDVVPAEAMDVVLAEPGDEAPAVAGDVVPVEVVDVVPVVVVVVVVGLVEDSFQAHFLGRKLTLPRISPRRHSHFHLPLALISL